MRDAAPPCTARDLDHVAIVVADIEAALRFYQETFGLGEAAIQELPDQRVRACLVTVGTTQLELIQPTDEASGVARFLQQRGEALHHIAFQVDNIESALEALRQRGVQLVDQRPRPGLAGTIAFIHPKATRGVLVELVEKEK